MVASATLEESIKTFGDSLQYAQGQGQLTIGVQKLHSSTKGLTVKTVIDVKRQLPSSPISCGSHSVMKSDIVTEGTCGSIT